jgi:hypothetical protein
MSKQNELNLEVAATPAAQPTLKDKAVSKALELLRNMGAGYIVMDEAGVVHTHGSVYAKKVKATKGKRRELTVPYGTLTTFVKSKGLLDMFVGDVLIIDPNPEMLDAKQVRGVASSLAGKVWGNESVMTTVNNGKVEILRLK